MKILKTILCAVAAIALLTISACENCDSALMTSNTWTLEEYGSVSAPLIPRTDSPVTLNFNTTDKKVEGSDGCNDYFGAYTLSDCSLSVGQIGKTRKLCQPQDIMTQAGAYTDILGAVKTFNTDGGKLQMRTADNRILVFKK